VWPYDGTYAHGDWATVKAFSELKDKQAYEAQLPGSVFSCVWITPELSPKPSATTAFSGAWGGSYTYQGQTVPCTGGFDALWIVCPQGKVWGVQANACVTLRERVRDKPKAPVCGFGHPIYPLTGSKTLREELGSWSVGGQQVTLGYDTRRKVPANDPTLVFNAVGPASFGELWTSSLHKSLVFQLDAGGVQQAVQASRGAGAWISFNRDSSGSYVADTDVPDRLVPNSGGWRYVDALERAEETYDSTGKLLTVAYINGSTLTYTYSTTPSPAVGLLLKVQDQLGRAVQFQYEQPSGVSIPRIKQIIDPNGQAIGVLYDANNNLAQLTWPDTKTRQFLYERTDLPWAVTGITDENSARLATYGYDTQGRANDTQWAGGADHYSANYTSAPGWNIVETYDSVAQVIWRDHYWALPQGTVITKPNGSTSSLSAALVQGMPRLSGQSQPAGSGCAASANAQTFDVNGNVSSKDDFNGSRACYVSDLSRNLETTRVEGLANTAACSSVTSTGAALPAGSRKVTTVWHPDWRLPIRVAEPGKPTKSVYNGQPDPFNSNAAASCSGTGVTLPSLPDGKPLPLLCKRVEQATTDTNGSRGADVAGSAAIPADPNFASDALLLHMD
jgi:hypothetical protein